MTEYPSYILLLIEKFLEGTATPNEKKELNSWYHSFDDSFAEVFSADKTTEIQIEARLKERLMQSIKKEQHIKNIYPIKHRRLYMAAAAVIALLLSASYLIYTLLAPKADRNITTVNTEQSITTILPGKNTALLTLANGSTIILDSMPNGTIASEKNATIKKLADGSVIYLYNEQKTKETSPLSFNTISTPGGGQYAVTLSDGSKVWLNAASSIRFPPLFTESQRKVLITGEVYFEVAHNPAKPFLVKAGNTEVEVLGTHFNINAYEDEAALKTTLIDGSIKVNANSHNTLPPVVLLPGQQAQINSYGKINIVKNIDLDEITAWKNGRFQFNSTDLKTVMRQIARWYNVDVVYKKNINTHFTGQLTRNEDILKVLEELSLTGEVHFKIEGRKIIVSK